MHQAALRRPRLETRGLRRRRRVQIALRRRRRLRRRRDHHRRLTTSRFRNGLTKREIFGGRAPPLTTACQGRRFVKKALDRLSLKFEKNKKKNQLKKENGGREG